MRSRKLTYAHLLSEALVLTIVVAEPPRTRAAIYSIGYYVLLPSRG